MRREEKSRKQIESKQNNENRKDLIMNSMDLTEGKMKKLDEVESDALDIVGNVMKDKRDVDDAAKMAIKMLSVAAKNRQTLTAREGVRFNMASCISDEKELRRYVEATQPEVKKYLKAK